MLTDEISKKVAKELGLKEDLVNKLNRIQYKFMLDTMQSGSLRSIQLMYIGKFVGKNDNNKTTRTDLSGMEESNIQD